MAKATKSKGGGKGGYGPASRCVPKQPTPNLPSSKRTDKY